MVLHASLTSLWRRLFKQSELDLSRMPESSMRRMHFPWRVVRSDEGWHHIVNNNDEIIVHVYSRDPTIAEMIVTLCNAEEMRKQKAYEKWLFTKDEPIRQHS